MQPINGTTFSISIAPQSCRGHYLDHEEVVICNLICYWRIYFVCVRCPHLLLFNLFLPKQAILSIKGLHPFIDRIIGGDHHGRLQYPSASPTTSYSKKKNLDPPTFVFCIQLWIRSVLYSPEAKRIVMVDVYSVRINLTCKSPSCQWRGRPLIAL